MPKLIATVVLYRKGPFTRIRRYWSGHHPNLGVLHFGWTGPETIEERDVLWPPMKNIFVVHPMIPGDAKACPLKDNA